MIVMIIIIAPIVHGMPINIVEKKFFAYELVIAIYNIVVKWFNVIKSVQLFSDIFIDTLIGLPIHIFAMIHC